MTSDSQFQAMASATLSQLYDALEPAYESGALEELEMETGLLTIATASGKTWLVSAHSPSRQLWLASPISGGLHFTPAQGQWVLAGGETLDAVLTRELHAHNIAIAS